MITPELSNCIKDTVRGRELFSASLKEHTDIMLLKFLFTFVLLALASAEKADFDKENVYTYEGYIAVGATEPTDYYSHNSIKADLHVLMTKKGEFWMHLDKVEFITFSGSKSDDEDDDYTDWTPIPEDSAVITLPFVYKRYVNESMTGIFTSEDDKPWSRNVKQAVANLFYHDGRIRDESLSSFHSEKDGFDYYVLRSEKEARVTKMMSEDALVAYAKENNDDVTIEEHFPMPSFKKYSYDFETGAEMKLKKIVALCTYEYNPLNGESEKFYASINQTFAFKEEVVSKMTDMDFERMTYSESNTDTYLTEAGALDMSKGRVNIDMDKIVEDLKKDLQKTFDNTHKSHISLTKTLINDGENLDSVIRRLKYLDEKHLNSLYSTFSENKDLSELVIEIISLMGTPASSFFIVNMVYEEKIEDQLALDALGNLPIHAIVLPEELKVKLTKLIKNSSVSEDIQRQAVLTLSNMISKSSSRSGHKYDDVIERFITTLLESEDEKEQLLYMYAISNIKSDTTQEVMLKIARGIKGYSKLTPHVRAESLYGLGRSEKEENALWVMFANKKEHIEVRLAAMNALVTADRPKNIEKMFWMLSEEDDDDELNHLFHTKLKAFTDTEMPSNEKGKVRAAELLPHFEKPHDSFLKSSTYLLESFDNDNGVGSAFEFTYYGDFFEMNFTSIRLRETSKLSGPISDTNTYSFYAKNIGGENTDFFELMGEFGVDMVTSKNGRILTMCTYKLTTILAMLSSNDDKIKYYMMEQEHSDEIVIQTDMGIPIVFRNNAGYIAKIEAQFIPEVQGKVLFDFVYRGNEIYGFTTYNPISDTWAGVRRVMTTDMKIPLNIDYKLNIEQKILKATLNKSPEPFGFQSFVYSHVFVKDSQNGEVLKKTCPKCEMDNFVSNGNDSLEGHVFLEGDNEDSGHYYKIAVYDCEQRVTASYISITDLESLWNLIMASSTPGMCGVGFMMKTSEKYPATHLDFTLKSLEDEGSGRGSKLSYNVRNSDQILKSWDINFAMQKRGPTWQSVKLNAMSTKEKSPKYKFCLETKDIWARENYFTSWTMKAGNDDSDSKCPESGSTISVEAQGSQSEEMKALADPETIFTSCDNDNSNNFYDCLREVSSYRFYEYDIKYQNLTDEETDFWTKISDFIRLKFGDEFVRMHKPKDVSENSLKIKVHYPLFYQSVNVSIFNHDEAYRYDDVVLGDMYTMYLAPYSTFAMYNDDFAEYCEAGVDYVSDEPDGDNEELTYDEGWAKLAELKNDDDSIIYEVKIKKDDDNELILYVQNDNETVELSFEKDFELKLMGSPKEMKKNELMKFMSFNILMTHNEDKNHRVFVHLYEKNTAIEYTPNKVRLSLKKGFSGQCDT